MSTVHCIRDERFDYPEMRLLNSRADEFGADCLSSKTSYDFLRMRIAFFSTKPYDRMSFDAESSDHELTYHEPRLTRSTMILAKGVEAICVFVNDVVDREVLSFLSASGLELVCLRCAGFNNVDLKAAHEFGVRVVRVPAYSPSAVAEHAFGLILSLNRHLHRAYSRVREGDFRLDGLLGFDLNGRKMGVVGTGRIGESVCRIANGFGCTVLAHDVSRNPSCEKMGVDYVELKTLFATADIISLHCPLTQDTQHMIDEHVIQCMKPGVMLINTSRGAMIDTAAVVQGLKSGQIGSLGIDVYEEEADLFFEDRSGEVLRDDTFARLLTFPNVMITGHQGFFTADALCQISRTTLRNATDIEQRAHCQNAVAADAWKS